MADTASVRAVLRAIDARSAGRDTANAEHRLQEMLRTRPVNWRKLELARAPEREVPASRPVGVVGSYTGAQAEALSGAIRWQFSTIRDWDGTDAPSIERLALRQLPVMEEARRRWRGPATTRSRRA